MFFITFLCLVSLRKFISLFNWSQITRSTLKTTWSLFIWNGVDLQVRTKAVPIISSVLLKMTLYGSEQPKKSLQQIFCDYVSIKSAERLLLFQSAGKAEHMMSDSKTTIDVHEFDLVASKSNHFPTVMNFCFIILSQRNISSRRFLMSLCELLLLFASSDANWGSGGGREGHLRAAVVVQFTRVCAAYHSSVRIRSSVRVSVPETPDVALWADRWNRVESGILNVHSQRDQCNVIPLNHTALNDNTLSLPLLQIAPKIITKKENYFHFLAAIKFCFFCWLLGNTD